VIENSRLRRLLLSLCALLPSACGSLVEPFEGIPRQPTPGTIEAGLRVAVCYNAMFSKPQDVRRIALEACGPNTIPQPARQDIRLSCPLLTPVRAIFVCAPE